MASDMLTKEMLEKEFSALGYICKNFIKLDKGIILNEFQEALGFTVHLTESGDYPYDSWDTIFLDHEFLFKKSLSFRFDKSFDNVEISYKVMLTVIFNLQRKLKTNALFLGCNSNELCFFTKRSFSYLNNENVIWCNSYFRDIISDTEYEFYSGEFIPENRLS